MAELIPSTPTQLLVTLVLVLPGFVFQETRIRLRGRTPGEQVFSGRLLRAISWSVAFSLTYVILFGPTITSYLESTASAVAEARQIAFGGLLFGLVIPGALALLPNMVRLQRLRVLLQPLQVLLSRVLGLVQSQYDSNPSAWDRAFSEAGCCFVRVRMSDGTWFAGYYGTASYASSFPDPPSLFLESSFAVDSDGTIGELIVGTAGSVIVCDDAVLVELLSPSEEVSRPSRCDTVANGPQ